MYNIIKTVINTGTFELADLIRKIDTVWLESKVTDEEKVELVALAQSKANPQHSMDLATKVADMDKRLRVLELQNKDAGTDEKEEYPAFEEGKWYYTGDKCSENGSNYICVAPEGTACVWSPASYPAYWELEEKM